MNTAERLLRHAKNDVCAGAAQTKLKRGPDGFGMALSDLNRITILDTGGVADLAGLKEMDRIIKVDGHGAPSL